MQINRSDFRFVHRLRVRWAEVDMQQIVFNAHYLMYFDTAISDYWRALALPYQAAMQQLGGDLYVVRAALDFHASARLDDQLEVALQCSRVGRSSIVFRGAIFCADAHLISADIVYVFADPATQTSQPVPAPLRAAMQAYERGEAVWQLQVGDWATLGAAAQALRREVFVREQGVPEHLEWDEADAGALHAVVCNRLGQPVATGRLLAYRPGVVKVGRMAVSRVLRGSGLGRQVLQALEDAARAGGERELLLHAQCSAQAFYARLGFEPEGERFDEAGMAHVAMRKRL
ncbi:YbgC/FadM family acyl-CoA thioesterase [Hydrogenophaga sp.]|uniref:YbgC/FadM family acyl-CoA thioesterase n=1 Tax=Hydrogenophaga sp. TaxID=1904254 RepID=UPI0019919628|nr:YbgC/FadM family acyl-CoA thioesterase [Hydrogenophaga sp.]MBD3892827.1 YbgC/FadM family acyl-CoA thioesterase [Hydrogenophaga sp.]